MEIGQKVHFSGNLSFWNFERFPIPLVYYNIEEQSAQPMFSPIDQFRQQYTIGEQIGRGAFSICYKATHKTLGTVAAAKKISILAEDASTTKSILNEISLLKGTAHPNVIKYVAAYASKDYAIILTEYEESRDLLYKITQMRRQGLKLAQKQIMGMFRQILEGLEYLHSNNIIHRDIKPSNIFVNHSDQIKIGDLGASKVVQEFNFTRIGTPYYLPPEIIRHENYSFSADIWSLGVTLYHLTYLQLPFKASNVIKLGQMIVDSQPLYPPSSCRRVEQAIRKMLAKDEKERPTARWLLEAYFGENVEREVSVFEMEEGGSVGEVQEAKDENYGTVVQLDFDKELYPDFMRKQSQANQEPTVKEISIRRSMMENSGGQTIIADNFAHSRPLSKRLTRNIQNRYGERKMTHVGKEAIDQNESTIVLTVNPTASRHQSTVLGLSSRKKTFFSNQSMAELNNYKKSSCFKDCVKFDSQLATSNFFEVKASDKNRESIYRHKREQSAIQTRQKHSELMQNLKRLKPQPSLKLDEDQANQQQKLKPKVTVCVPTLVVLR